jgi:hypothetical protein
MQVVRSTPRLPSVWKRNAGVVGAFAGNQSTKDLHRQESQAGDRFARSAHSRVLFNSQFVHSCLVRQIGRPFAWNGKL